MNRSDLYAFAKRMGDFATRPASQSISSLPHPYGHVPQEARGTNTEYAFRLILEGLDILRCGDSLIQCVRFTEKDINQCHKGVLGLGRCIKSPHLLKKSEGNALLNLPVNLQKILTYHLDKAQACNAEFSRLRDQLTSGREQFKRACEGGDYNALARLYPYADGVLEIEGKDALPGILARKMDMPAEWYSGQRAAKIKQLFHSATCLDPQHVASWLGRPETGVSDGALSALRHDQERNFTLWKAGQKFIADLSEATGKPLPDLTTVDDLTHANQNVLHNSL